EAVRRGREPERAAVRAARRSEAALLRRVPDRLRGLVGVAVRQDRREHTAGRRHAALLASRVPLTGSAAGPPVTSATSAPSTWLTAVPRICSTASRTCVMPMMYASDRLPPCVLTGIVPVFQRMLPSATNGPPSPIG